MILVLPRLRGALRFGFASDWRNLGGLWRDGIGSGHDAVHPEG